MCRIPSQNSREDDDDPFEPLAWWGKGKPDSVYILTKRVGQLLHVALLLVLLTPSLTQPMLSMSSPVKAGMRDK